MSATLIISERLGGRKGSLLLLKHSCCVASHWKGLIYLVALLLSGSVDEVLCLLCKSFQGQAMCEQVHGHHVAKFTQGAPDYVE